ncbi:DUF1837 domain-containing protein [Clostridium baratii]|uniref:HamA C-terminal domain-containing protein n=1 Tax=Clostridium baratii TaxID=1561 RepID=UPI00097FA89E|nr:DUF1837 domain-containing protein [Clostridium baratii]AQM61320.1 hypothetical protein NPD11_2688 [Clostridium baratii]
MSEELLELLPLTVDETDFNKVFIPLEHDFSLNLANENKLEIYHLRAENRKFNYEDLTEFCVGNLNQYVFSRQAVKGAKTSAEIQRLFNKGRRSFREIRNNNDKGEGGELGELLLYLFLEIRLRAPKILSKMEIKTTQNQYVYGADGVHLYFTHDEEGFPIYQLIIGEAKIKNDILDATRVAFDSIKNSINEINVEICLISGEIFKEVCNEREADIIKSMIIPTEDSKNELATYEKAIGVFIGYTGNYDEDISNSKWNRTLNEKIKGDIGRAVKTMVRKIENLDLRGYSFYCYYMPFNNAELDRKSILDNIL